MTKLKSRIAPSLIAALVALFVPQAAVAQASFDAESGIFRLDGGDVTYAFGLGEGGVLKSIYWGPRIAASDRLSVPKLGDISSTDPASSIDAQEYPGWGGAFYTMPALKAAWPDGNRDVVLRYRSSKLEPNAVVIELSDIRRPLGVTLRYSIDPASGIVGRSARITNNDRVTVRVDEAASATWSLPVGGDYRLHYLTGQWAGEWQLQSRPVTAGSTVIGSRRGTTGHEANPWFAISRGEAREDHGPVWFGALAWSGSWQIGVDQNPRGDVRIVGGYNPFDFGYRLLPGQSLDTPVFFGGYSDDGMGKASRLLHRFELDTVVPGSPKPRLRPILYNSWEATGFAVDERGQAALAEKAASLGVERFVVDDGWFGARNNDKAGLGDWTVNSRKFPRGLKPLIDRVHGLGMEFGLWVEPEMVNADSDLFRAHPDWVMHMPDRPRSEARNQMVLDLSRTDVRDLVLETMDRLLRENDIQFIKWDHNRDFSEPGSAALPPEDQQRVATEYVRNFYYILDELRRRHPKVEFESCAGGGGRVDLGVLHRADQVWPSDNTDPYDRLRIQDGFSRAYSPGLMMAWVTDSPNWANDRRTSLRYRFLSSMQGGLGIGADLNKWKAEDFAEAKRFVAAYKEIRETVQRGDLHRLISPQDGSDRSATFYVSRDRRQAVLFAFLHSGSRLSKQPAIQVRGLDPAARYRVRPIVGQPGAESPVQSGAFWMSHGIEVPMTGDFQAEGRIFEIVP